MTDEGRRLEEARQPGSPWRKWGPYLAERQWGTVREDYSEGGQAWDHFSHEQAPSRAYRWGEDGLAGISDDQQRLCFALALWNGVDPILKEPRAAAVFPTPVHRAAAVRTLLVPGLRFVHDGQRSGRRRRASNHLRRRALEPIDRELESFYGRLLACMRRTEVREGDWRLLEAEPAWDGNLTWSRFIAFAWEAPGCRLLVAVNYGPTPGQCYVRLPWADLDGRALQDLLTPSLRYEREGADLRRRGLCLDVPAWRSHVFEVIR